MRTRFRPGLFSPSPGLDFHSSRSVTCSAVAAAVNTAHGMGRARRCKISKMTRALGLGLGLARTATMLMPTALPMRSPISENACGAGSPAPLGRRPASHCSASWRDAARLDSSEFGPRAPDSASTAALGRAGPWACGGPRGTRLPASALG